ncbi:type III pantothenate kinase [Colwellia sp. MEBiC06753]
MRLLVDIGNTRVKYCAVDSGQISAVRFCDNISLTYRWLDDNWQSCNEIVLASVAQACFAEVIEQWAVSRKISLTKVETCEQAFGVTNGYDNPSQLGIDRWLGLLGANKLYADLACLIIDAGTATTVDYIDASGHFHGGWILAGIDTLFFSIQSQTAKVSGTNPIINSQAFGKNTNDNLAQAAWGATLGLINQAIELLKREQLPLDKVIITGGNSEALIALLALKVEHQPLLVFHGLSRYLLN